ncbi:DUF2865 domain-containing protein [Afifella pfennigii]|uniref:DUF2865 domain-containing protein n=1 Tax=Afifella pfennigii TaxID=209897 RepID=UPI00068FE8AA|nr:DUF2865 domain-containing protein [Afifella pfennigii]
MRASGRLLAAAIILTAGFGATGPALALSCQTLEAELVRLESRPARPDPRALRYERAFREQAAVLDRAERRAERAGCLGGGFLFFRAEPPPSCGPMLDRLSEMRANLDKLERLRSRHAGGGVDIRRADRVRELMARQGCGGRFADARTRSWGPPEAGPYGPRFFARDGYATRGAYRTLCVRRCDGYYFPISFSTTPGRFAQDEATCQARCPGAETSLYIQPDPNGDPADMISLAGEPYGALPSAFRYRESLDKSCTCQASQEDYAMIASPRPAEAPPVNMGGGLKVYGEAGAQEMMPGAGADSNAWPAMPRARPDPAKLETTASLDLRGSKTEGANEASAAQPAASEERAKESEASEVAATPADAPPSKAAATTEEAASEADDGEASRGKVRIVGPSYWGGPQKEEVLVAPVRR